MRKKNFIENVLAGVIIGMIIAVSMTAAFLKSQVMGWLYVVTILIVAVTTAYEWTLEMKSKNISNKLDMFRKAS